MKRRFAAAVLLSLLLNSAVFAASGTDSTQSLAGRLALLDTTRHDEGAFQSIIDTLGTYTTAGETEIVAMITVAFGKLRNDVDGLSIYDVASGIRDITEVVLAAGRRHGLSEREDLAYMTAIYIVLKQRESGRVTASIPEAI